MSVNLLKKSLNNKLSIVLQKASCYVSDYKKVLCDIKKKINY